MSTLLLLYWWNVGLPEKWSGWYTAVIVADLLLALPEIVDAMAWWVTP